MASKKGRRIPTNGAERPRKDRVAAAKRMHIEEMQAKEADMEARSLGSLRRIAVVCPKCRHRTEYDLGNRIPVDACPNCGNRIALRHSSMPQVVNR